MSGTVEVGPTQGRINDHVSATRRWWCTLPLSLPSNNTSGGPIHLARMHVQSLLKQHSCVYYNGSCRLLLHVVTKKKRKKNLFLLYTLIHSDQLFCTLIGKTTFVYPRALFLPHRKSKTRFYFIFKLIGYECTRNVYVFLSLFMYKI